MNLLINSGDVKITFDNVKKCGQNLIRISNKFNLHLGRQGDSRDAAILRLHRTRRPECRLAPEHGVQPLAHGVRGMITQTPCIGLFTIRLAPRQVSFGVGAPGRIETFQVGDDNGLNQSVHMADFKNFHKVQDVFGF
jgi:hypothetical protein